MSKNRDIKVAIVADEMVVRGGAQSLIQSILRVYPDAPIYTSVYEKSIIDEHFPGRKVVASPIQKFPFEKKLRKEYFLFYPWAFKRFDFSMYDVVISITSAYAKHIRMRQNSRTKHLMICLTPPRYLWIGRRSIQKKRNRISYFFYSILQPQLHTLWRWQDKKAAQRADKVYSISNVVKKRVKSFYELDSEILYPPVEVDAIKFNRNIKSRKDWMLYFGRVETYKGVDLAIRACVATNVPLKVVGRGSDLENMKKLVAELKAENLIEFDENCGDEKRNEYYYYYCRALIYPVKDEDFGIVPVEANASGAPVIAFRGGGSLETISEDNPRTGIFFNEYTSQSLADAIKSLSRYEFNPQSCRKQASQFATKLFEYKIKTITENAVQVHKKIN